MVGRNDRRTRSMGRGATLPNECLLLIAQFCDPTTLRQFRLASRTTSALGLSHLFASIRLVPNVDCLASFVQTFKASPARSAIRTVVYDLSWETIISDLIARCDSAKSDSGPDSYMTRPAAWIHKVDIDQLRRIYDSRLSGPSVSVEEIGLLNSVLSCTPSVSGLVVVSDCYDRDYKRPVPFFYQSVLSTVDMLEARSSLLLPLGPATDDSSHLHSVLSAIKKSETQLLRLTLQDAKWSSLGGHVAFAPNYKTDGKLSFWKCVLGNLLDLDLSFRGSLSRQSVESIKPLRRFLKACNRAKSLRLSFNESIQKRYSHDQRMCSYLGPLLSPGSSTRPLMPGLESLVLRNATSSQHDLVKFLSIHAKSLKHLRLSNISLLRHDGQDCKSCWVETIKSFKSVLTLAQVEFGGWLTNGGRQKWYVSENTADSGRIRPLVERYITDKTIETCPLERVAIRVGHEDVEEPVPGTDEVRGDWTWTMVYPAKKQRHFVGEQTFSGDHFFSEDVPLEPNAEDIVMSSRARPRNLSTAGQPTPPPTDFGMPWPESYQQPPTKKIKSTHTPISVPSPSSIWSSSPEAWDSSTSSPFDAPATTSNKAASSFASKTPVLHYTTQSAPMQAVQAQKFGLSHAFWGGPKPPSTAFAWPTSSGASKPVKNFIAYQEHVTPYMSLAETAQHKAFSDSSWPTAGTSAPVSTNVSHEAASGNSFGFSMAGYNNVEMLDAFETVGLSASIHNADAATHPLTTFGTSQTASSASNYYHAFTSAQYQPTVDGWWLHSSEANPNQEDAHQACDLNWPLPDTFSADVFAEMQVNSEGSFQAKGKGKATAW